MNARLAAFVLALAALAATAVSSHAAVGDVVALVRSSSVVPASPRAATQAEARLLLPDAAFGAALARVGMSRVTALGAPVANGIQPMQLVRISPSAAPDQAQAHAAARTLVAGGDAIAAVADHALKLFATVPNDTFVVDQWYVDGTGDIHLPEAWDLEKATPSVVIGILDTGVDTGHPDLASKIWTNPGEIAGNGIDDDGNGYIDDVHGWDFGDDDNDPNPGPLFDDLGIDEGFHGTSVAGVAAAATNNVEGIAGAGWNAKIMPLKIADSAGQTLLSYAAEGILYAANKHPGVLNMSVGTSQADSADIALFQSVVNQAVAGNVVCVASAGNDDSTVPVYPAACDGVLAVGATTDTDTRADFSNSGPWVDVGAPGSGMIAPICRNYTIDDTSEFIYEFFFGYDGVHPYMYSDGTSFSAPLAAGVCALVRAHFPSATPVGVILHVIQTGDAIAYDKPIGKKVNAYQALLQPLAVDGPTANAAGALEFLGARPSPFSGSTTLAYRLPAAGAVRLAIVDAAGRRVRSLVDGTVAGGIQTAAWNGLDDAGRRAPAGLYFAVLDSPAGRTVTRLVKIAP